MPDLKRKQQENPQQSQVPQLEQQKVPKVQVKIPQVQLEEPQVQLHKSQVQPHEPQVLLHKPQLQEPLEQHQDPSVQDHQSISKADRSYKEALASPKYGDIILSCDECSYPFRSK